MRLYFLTNALLFLAFSVACTFAQNLEQMIVLRAIQGFCGGVLIPLAFMIVITLLPKAKQPIGLALFALSATFAPAIGPTIGGYATQNKSEEHTSELQSLMRTSYAVFCLKKKKHLKN